MDVSQPLPFEHESFDVIHARFVLMHVSWGSLLGVVLVWVSTFSLLDSIQLPHFRDTLARICTLIKPGGHLILEEIDARTYSDHQETPEAVTYFYDRLYDWVSKKGETYDVGSELQPYVSKLGMFIDVTVKVLAVPFSPGWDGRKYSGLIVT